MRWVYVTIAIAVMAVLAYPVDAQKKIVLDHGDRRFDHEAHAQLLSGKGKKLECTGACHEVNAAGVFQKSGKREHARCFDCHSYTTSKSTLAGVAGRVCYPCHGDKLKYRPSNLGPVNAKKDTTYVAVYSHKKHTSTSAQTGRQCEQCHGEFGDGAPKTTGALANGHAMCSGCHERGMEPLMNQCSGCHFDKNSDRGKAPVVQPRGPNRYATTGAFSHTRHARADRVGTKGKECLTCHANIKEAADDTAIPMPTMKGCYESCHNGKQAFDATGASCTRCHQGGRK